MGINFYSRIYDTLMFNETKNMMSTLILFFTARACWPSFLHLLVLLVLLLSCETSFFERLFGGIVDPDTARAPRFDLGWVDLVIILILLVFVFFFVVSVVLDTS